MFPGKQARKGGQRAGRRGSGGVARRGGARRGAERGAESGAGGGMLAAGAPSAGNSAAQVKRSRGGQGNRSTNGRAVCKCPGPGEPMRAAAALRRGTGWLRGEAGPRGGTAPPFMRRCLTHARRPSPISPGRVSRCCAVHRCEKEQEVVGDLRVAVVLLLSAVSSGKHPGPQELFAEE